MSPTRREFLQWIGISSAAITIIPNTETIIDAATTTPTEESTISFIKSEHKKWMDIDKIDIDNDFFDINNIKQKSIPQFAMHGGNGLDD